MYRQTLASIKTISSYSTDPSRAEKAMHNVLSCSIKLCKKVLTKDFMCVLNRCGIGTNEVEICVRKLCRKSVKRGRKYKLVKLIMKDKVEDAKLVVEITKREFDRQYIEYHRIVDKGSPTDT